MSSKLAIKYVRGSLVKLLKTEYSRMNVTTLHINKGHHHPYEYHELIVRKTTDPMFPDLNIKVLRDDIDDENKLYFPKLKTLILDDCDTHYMYYLTTFNFIFPKVETLYLKDIKFDYEALYSISKLPKLKNIYIVNSREHNTNKYREYYDELKLKEIELNKFKKLVKYNDLKFYINQTCKL